MRTGFDLMKALAFGAVDVEETEKGAVFHRFTPEQFAVFGDDADLRLRSRSSSGVRLEFVTDARSFTFAGRAEPASSQEFCYFDVYIDGVLCRHLGCPSCVSTPEFEFAVELPEGTNKVAVYLPGVARVALRRLEFAGATQVLPVKKSRRVVCYGDSITQGNNARYPSLAYANAVADALDAELFNKAVGGDCFNPALARLPDIADPDLVTVAYGTNDWTRRTRETIAHDAAEFFDILEANYPGIPIYAMLPLWRSDCGKTTAAGTFADVARIIHDAASAHTNVRVVDGFKLLPHLDACLSDGLHPNDFGFTFVTRGLLRRITLG